MAEYKWVYYIIHHVPKNQTTCISDSNRNKPSQYFPPHLKYLTPLSWKVKTFECVANYALFK